MIDIRVTPVTVLTKAATKMSSQQLLLLFTDTVSEEKLLLFKMYYQFVVIFQVEVEYREIWGTWQWNSKPRKAKTDDHLMSSSKTHYQMQLFESFIKTNCYKYFNDKSSI